jgi:hypothetical protein
MLLCKSTVPQTYILYKTVEHDREMPKEFQLHMQNPIWTSNYALLHITFIYELF